MKTVWLWIAITAAAPTNDTVPVTELYVPFHGRTIAAAEAKCNRTRLRIVVAIVPTMEVQGACVTRETKE